MLSDVELDRIGRDSEERLAWLRAISDDLAREQFTASSGAASALVDGHGALLDLRIADEVLTVRTLDLDTLNQDIVAAITGARQRAAARAGHLLRPVFPAMFPDEADTRHRTRG